MSATRRAGARTARWVKQAAVAASTLVMASALAMAAAPVAHAAAGTVTSYTGTGVANPFGITAGPDGNLWFTNGGNNSIGRVTPAGVVTNYTGTGISSPIEITAGPDGNLWFTNLGNDSIGRITPAGVVTNYTGAGIKSPVGITAGPDNALWFANGGNDSIGRITPAGVVTNYSGAGVSSPWGITAAADNNLYFTNSGNSTIGRITPAGTISNITGQISIPNGIAAGADGNVWFTNVGTDSIGRVTPAGVVTTYTSATIGGPWQITPGPDNNLWFTNFSKGSIGRITADVAPKAPNAPTGVTAVAGNAKATVTWVAPTIDGGSPITSYTVTSSPGGKTCTWTTGAKSCVVSGLTNGTSYTFTVTATNAVGTSVPSLPSNAVVPFAPGAYFHSMNPTRLLDSRTSTGGWPGPLGAGAGNARTLKVAGVGLIPANAQAVVMNVTVTEGTQNSFLTVYPGGQAVPNASNLNFGIGQTVPNLVTVQVGTNGNVAFFNALGTVDVIVDVVGFYNAVALDKYTALTPTRVLDSRGPVGGWGGPLLAGNTNVKSLTVANGTTVPTTAHAVVINVTATQSSTGSFLTVYPAGGSVPNASNLNFGPGSTIANLVTVKVGTGGAISFWNAVGSVEVVADIVGYYDTASGDLFHPVAPVRALDSRTAVGGWSGPLGPGPANVRSLTVAGAGGVLPASATSVVANATITEGTTGSFLTVYPTGQPLPNASNINFGAGQTTSNLTAVKLGTNGRLDFANALGSVNVIYDVVGYFAAQ